jgi:hypothetical protein
MSFSPSRSRDNDNDNEKSSNDEKRPKFLTKDIIFTCILFSFPVLAIFFQIFTFCSGFKYWTVIVKTEAFGVVKVGVLGICPEEGQ